LIRSGLCGTLTAILEGLVEPLRLKSTPKSQNKRGDRRARQNKHSGKSGQSSLTLSKPTSKMWNANSQQWPMFNNTLKKDNQVHNFIQFIDLGGVYTSSAAGATGYARCFYFTDVLQYASFSTLFDQYRITEIEIWWNPGVISNSTNLGVTNYMYTVTDYDDDATPSGPPILQQYTNVMMGSGVMGHYRRWKPHVADALYSGAFTSYGNLPAPWIDVASPGVKHYGFKAASSGAGTTANQIPWSLSVRIHFQCRNVF
jgi:hypothetical protein